jgi:hypothetical protein
MNPIGRQNATSVPAPVVSWQASTSRAMNSPSRHRLRTGKMLRMRDDRKRQFWPWILALIGITFFYFLSKGPADLVIVATCHPEWLDTLFVAGYTPFWCVNDHLSPSLQQFVGRYEVWWMQLGFQLEPWLKG